MRYIFLANSLASALRSFLIVLLTEYQQTEQKDSCFYSSAVFFFFFRTDNAKRNPSKRVASHTYQQEHIENKTQIRYNIRKGDENRMLSPIITELIQRRKKLHISQQEVARRMGTTQTTVARVERSDHVPRLETIERYAKAIQCHLILVDDNE